MTNLTLVQEIVRQSTFDEGRYSIEFLSGKSEFEREDETYYQDLALIAALAYLRKNRPIFPSVPDRLLSGWHRESRRLPG